MHEAAEQVENHLTRVELLREPARSQRLTELHEQALGVQTSRALERAFVVAGFDPLNPLKPHHATALGAWRVFQVINSPFHPKIKAQDTRRVECVAKKRPHQGGGRMKVRVLDGTGPGGDVSSPHPVTEIARYVISENARVSTQEIDRFRFATDLRFFGKSLAVSRSAAKFYNPFARVSINNNRFCNTDFVKQSIMISTLSATADHWVFPAC